MIITNALIYFRYIRFPETKIQNVGQGLSKPSEQIADNYTIGQRFIPEGKAIDSLSIFFSTYNDSARGFTNVSIVDPATDKKTFSIDLNNEAIKDNDYYSIDLNGLEMDNKEYLLVLTSLDSPGLSVWYDDDGKINFKLNYTNSIGLNEVIVINLFYLFLNIGFICLLKFLKNN